jgi:hypothetical protein
MSATLWPIQLEKPVRCRGCTREGMLALYDTDHGVERIRDPRLA